MTRRGRTVTVEREGAGERIHRCDLPAPTEERRGMVVRCEECGRRWKCKWACNALLYGVYDWRWVLKGFRWFR